MVVVTMLVFMVVVVVAVVVVPVVVPVVVAVVGTGNAPPVQRVVRPKGWPPLALVAPSVAARAPLRPNLRSPLFVFTRAAGAVLE